MPDAYIDTDLITEHWDASLRFIATIKLKHTTATQLFKRLNSYSKQHTLYRALKEFGKIIKSIFILKYIDDPEFRQSIEKQLNKIESAQKFSKAVSFGHNQEFMQGEKEEQEITAGCRRLIASLRTRSSAGTTSIFRNCSARQTRKTEEPISWSQSGMAQSSVGSTSTCTVSTISQTTNCKIPSV